MLAAGLIGMSHPGSIGFEGMKGSRCEAGQYCKHKEDIANSQGVCEIGQDNLSVDPKHGN